MGISCDPLQQQWWDKLNALRRFHAEHAHRRVLTGGRYHGVVLSRFIAKLRKAREAGRFTQQHIAAADELGISWQIAGRRDQPGRPRRAAACAARKFGSVAVTCGFVRGSATG